MRSKYEAIECSKCWKADQQSDKWHSDVCES